MHTLDLERLAARRGGTKEPDVVIRPFALAGESEQRSIGRPGGIRRLCRGTRITKRGRRSIARRHPDLVMATVLVLYDRRHDERHSATVGGKLWIADHGELVVIGGLPRPRLLGQD